MKKEQMVTHDSAAPDLGIVKPITIPANKRSKVTYMYISYIYKYNVAFIMFLRNDNKVVSAIAELCSY